MPSRPHPASTFTERVTDIGAKFPSAYGGMTMSSPGNPIIYVVASHRSAFLKEVDAAAADYPGQHYTAVDVAHSWVQLMDLTNNRIASDEPDWRARGVYLDRWGPDPTLNKVLIQLRHPTAQAVQALLAAYGREWVAVSLKPFTEKLVFKDRCYDSAPSFGGDAIFPDKGDPDTYCTDSFTRAATAVPWPPAASQTGGRVSRNLRRLPG